MATLVAFCHVLTAAFSPTGLVAPRPAVAVSPAAAMGVRMVAAPEVYDTFVQSQPLVRQKIKDVGPSATKGGLAGIVAAAAAVGYVLTPSSRILVNAVGGAATGALGLVARKRLAEERRETAATAVAALLSRGLSKVSADEVAAVAEQYGVPRPRFQKQLGELFLVYLGACLSSSEILTSELSELLQLKSLLKLSAAQVGTQAYAAGRQVYSRHRAYLEDSEPSDSKQILTKFIFLAERLISKDESEEGYRYEAMRAQRLFGLSAEEWAERAESCAIPFYEKTLASAVLSGVQATADQLGSVRGSLGVTQPTADRLHASVYSTLARSLIKPEDASAAQLSAEARAKLDATAQLLQMSDEAAAAVVAQLTEPLYEAAVSRAVAELEEMPSADEAACAPILGALTRRQEQLGLTREGSAALKAKVMRARAAERLSEAARALRVQDVNGAVACVDKMLDLCGRSAKLLGESTGALYNDLGAGVMREADVLSLYRLELLHCLTDMNVDTVQQAKLSTLRGVLGLSPSAAARVYEAAAGPMLRRVIDEAVAKPLSEEAKDTLAAARRGLDLPESAAADIAVAAYTKKLAAMAPDGKIPTEAQSTELNELRDFLDLSVGQVYAAHKETFTAAYRKSIKEVMDTEGAIPDEYWEGLDKLRERLVLSPETSEELFAEEAQSKMAQYGKKALEALEKAANKEADKSIDMADETSVAAQVLALVEFCVQARVLVPQVVEAEEGGQAVTKDVEVAGTTLGSRFEKRQLRELYRQFLVEAFQDADKDKSQRLFSNLERLALVLGLPDDVVSAVHNEIGGTIYRRYLGRALQDGGDIGPSENQFLDSIRDTLGLAQERCDELVRDMKVNRVATLIESMFEGSNLNPAEIRKCVAAAEQFDVDLLEDLQLPTPRLEKMFTLEMEDLIETGQLTVDNTDALSDSCEAFHVSEARATEMVEASVAKRCAGGVLQATACLRRGAITEMVDTLKRTLQYARLSPAAVAVPMVSDKEKGELYMLFQAQMLADGATADDCQPDLDLLKTVVGLGQEQVA